MPTYHYKCSECTNDFEQYQSIHDDALTMCNHCGNNTLFRVIYLTDCFVENITTVGQQADKNARLMGQSEVQERHLKRQETHKSIKSVVNVPNVDLSLNKLNKAQQERYIYTGKK